MAHKAGVPLNPSLQLPLPATFHASALLQEIAARGSDTACLNSWLEWLEITLYPLTKKSKNNATFGPKQVSIPKKNAADFQMQRLRR